MRSIFWMAWTRAGASASSRRWMWRSRPRRWQPSMPAIPPLTAAVAAEYRRARDPARPDTRKRVQLVIESSLDQLTLPPIIAGLPSGAAGAQTRRRRGPKRSCRRADANVVLARAAFFPSINLTASGGFASTVLSNLLTPESKRIFEVAAILRKPFSTLARVAVSWRNRHARYDELSDYRQDRADGVRQCRGRTGGGGSVGRPGTTTAGCGLTRPDGAFEYAQLQMQAGTTNIMTELNTENCLVHCAGRIRAGEVCSSAGHRGAVSGAGRWLATTSNNNMTIEESTRMGGGHGSAHRAGRAGGNAATHRAECRGRSAVRRGPVSRSRPQSATRHAMFRDIWKASVTCRRSTR